MNKDDAPYTCDNCGQSNEPNDLFAGACCPACYNIIVEPLTRVELIELFNKLSSHTVYLESQLETQEAVSKPPALDSWEGLDTWQTIAIKWQFHMLGGYFSLLMQQIAKADTDNMTRLRRGYPDHVKAYELFMSEPGWWDKTLVIAKQKGYVKENQA